MFGFLAALVVLAIIGAVAYVAKHQHVPAVSDPRAAAVSVAAQVADAVREGMSEAPSLISSEVQRLNGELDTAVKRAEAAEAKWAAEHQDAIQKVEAIKAWLGAEVDRIAAGAAADLPTIEQRIEKAMSQAGDEIVTKLQTIATEVQAKAEGAVAAEKADHDADIANIAAAVDQLGAQVAPPAAPEPAPEPDA